MSLSKCSLFTGQISLLFFVKYWIFERTENQNVKSVYEKSKTINRKSKWKISRWKDNNVIPHLSFHTYFFTLVVRFEKENFGRDHKLKVCCLNVNYVINIFVLVMADSHVDPKGHVSNNKNYITKKTILPYIT